MSKEYGLIIPGKGKMVVQAPGKRAAIFDEESDSDDSHPTKAIVQKEPIKRNVQLAQEKALAEDPTVYQYDEIFDDMQKQRDETKLLKKGIDRKPKYIGNLLKAAEKRKRENEQRFNRQVQKERDAEGDQFKDKESYVSLSYQKKLEELKLLEEEEKREEYLESIGDVKKQGNLDGFYRHLYDQKLNYEDSSKDMEKETTNEDEAAKEDEIKPDKSKKKANSRHYRKRDDSNSEDEIFEVKKEHLASNLDADSDFSIDSSDSEENESKVTDSKEVKEEPVKETVEVKLEENTEITNDTVEKIEEPVSKKPKIDIYKKRTVGQVFEDARQRYFERCALRNSA